MFLCSGSGEQSRSETISTLRENEEDDISQCLDAPGAADSADISRANMGMGKGVDDNKDDIAEPLYTLMSEVFDMRGLFKWIRKSLITFVQITYGRTINRQIRDTISWCFSESMLHYYITVLLKTWWPGGELAADGPERSDQMKAATAQLAREQFVENVPDILCTLVGAQNARRGASKVFETVQNRQLNKQLFYVSVYINSYTRSVKKNRLRRESVSGYLSAYNFKFYFIGYYCKIIL